jgi:hypothetical protein
MNDKQAESLAGMKGVQNTAGKLNANMVWVFALVAAGLAFALTYIPMGRTIFWGALGAIFVIMGFLATFLTSAKTGIAAIAMVVASAVFTGLWYWRISAVTSAVTSAVGAMGGSGAGAAAEKAASIGLAVMLVPLAITLVDCLVTGIVGAIAGAKVRDKAKG